MDEVKRWHVKKIAEKLEKNLKKRNIDFFYLEDKESLFGLIKEYVEEGDIVSYGGSSTLEETGVLDFFRNGNYNFLDREEFAPGEARDLVYRKSFGADSYFLSANAVTTEGEIVNVDGNGNRIAAMIFGPKQVFIIIGTNKIVSDMAEAEERLKFYAGPMDAKKLDKKTPCTTIGKCVDCNSEERICNKYLVYRREPRAGRMKVVLINESLGY